MAQIRLEKVTRKFQRNEEDADLAAVRGQFSGSDEAIPSGRHAAALDNLSLTVPDGKACVLVGPSGCGKSTLLRIVAGLDTEYTGDVYYDDHNMRDVPPKDRYIGMVFQNYALYPHFHGQNNLRFTFWVRKAPDAEAEERIRTTAKMMGFGFNQLLHRKPGTLSGGQQQRLAIARALVRNPQLFLLDEPLSNLDAKLRAQTRIEIKRLLQKFQITTIYVTHDQEEAIALGDLIAIMRSGHIEQVGTQMELRTDPVNTFVAGFMGPHPMNLVEGEVNAAGLLHLGEVEGADLPLPSNVQDKATLGARITLGVRPEALRLDFAPTPSAQGPVLSGEVETIEPDFARRTQFVRVHTSAGVLTVADTTNEPLALTQRVSVVLPATEDALFFDTASGQRI